MSIANIQYLPVLTVQNLQITNPALQSVSLATDANGNIVSNGGSADSGIIPAGTILARDGSTVLDSSTSSYVIDEVNRLVYLFLGIPNVSNWPAGGAAANLLVINTSASSTAPSILPPINNDVISDANGTYPTAILGYSSESVLPVFFGVKLTMNTGRIDVEVGPQWGQTLTVPVVANPAIPGSTFSGSVVPLPVPTTAQSIVGTIIYPF